MALKIKKIEGALPVYDLTVDKTSNFFANDILVHNCNEIYQATSEDVTAICTLSSLVLKNFIKEGKFDFKLLHDAVRKATRSLNKVIDINKYSTKKGEKGGLEQRAIGIGVQGLADVFLLLDYVYDSEESKDLNKKIFETIYHAAIMESNELCKSGEYKPYKFFKGSPMSKGIFQFDMWGLSEDKLSGMWNWTKLKDSVKEHGISNSLFTACMPVAGSAKNTGSYEMTEPAHSALFSRRVIGGEIVVVNKYLVSDLEEIGIWSEDIKNEIIMNDGSIQKINFNKYLNSGNKSYESDVKRIEHLLLKYRTVWEIPQKEIIKMAADRGPFIDQSQSMNLYFENPNPSRMTSAAFYAWEAGLKTLNYYIRSKAISTGAKHLGVDTTKVSQVDKVSEPQILPQKPDNSPFECEGCSA